LRFLLVDFSAFFFSSSFDDEAAEASCLDVLTLDFNGRIEIDFVIDCTTVGCRVEVLVSQVQ
jgi:hypothetical protein